jgi:hypothetical protein
VLSLSKRSSLLSQPRGLTNPVNRHILQSAHTEPRQPTYTPVNPHITPSTHTWGNRFTEPAPRADQAAFARTVKALAPSLPVVAVDVPVDGYGGRAGRRSRSGPSVLVPSP